MTAKHRAVEAVEIAEPEAAVEVLELVAEESEGAVDAWPPAAGTIIERTATGWIARVVYGGAVRLHGEGETPEAAVRSAV